MLPRRSSQARLELSWLFFVVDNRINDEGLNDDHQISPDSSSFERENDSMRQSQNSKLNSSNFPVSTGDNHWLW